ncbi:ShlB/FhaC/HecB family hemolysin secretion/activation protein [Janthinobacterium sp. GW460P]|uniref:ShlB/FhaC/HecB family hemolysin secretion/activation protein n=1 Tax=unclassified Janthinobacterium TaxID=2610881 RepID=UPI000A327657|nr:MULTISPECIES: ShlB/FhaC/HecB family hemolysin secretion/activation protein [unclassified Janthinobacterium]MCC7705340.1 ShlB/FhaC/HecB family hemolysin secretion/activation protein [Janthinobacterium sp. GW460P]MCC7710842.1 ShlB/FhaC/HecB family hemolysin secretion/activation protein [Janthinobacterium sp. GW460W]
MREMTSKGRGVPPAAPATALTMLCLAMLGLPGMARAQDAVPAAAPVAAPERQVTIEEYLVRGNTVLDARAIEAAVTPFLGPGRTLKDVEGARDALVAAYQARGYQSVYVDLPEQQVEQGVVVLQVSETKVGRLRVVGAQYNSPLDVRQQVPALTEGKVPDFTQAQVELTALNRGPKRQVMPLVKQGSLPGTMDVDLKVEDSSPWRANVGLNNDYSADTKKLRTSMSVGHDNLWQLGHSATISFFGTPGDLNQTKVWSASYVAPIGTQGWSVEATGYQSNSNVASTGGTSVLGKGHALGMKLNYTVPNSGIWWHSFSAGIDFKDNQEALTLNGTGSNIPLKYVPLSVSYNGFAQTETATYGLGLSLVAGTRAAFGYGSDSAAYDNKRYKTSPSFLVLKGDANATYTLGSGAQLHGRMSGQLADAALVSGEQMAAGGANSVRGYLSAEATGDYGVSGTVEWRTPQLTYFSRLENWRLFAFADGARLRLRDPMIEQKDLFGLASVGVGSSFQFLRYLNGRIDFSYPLRDGPRTHKHVRRINFNLSASY